MHGLRSLAPWLLLVLASPAAAAQELVGRSVPPYPDGLAPVLGSCMSESSDPERICDFSLAVIGSRDGDAVTPRFVVAERNAGYDGASPRWEVTDAVPYPATDKDRYFQVGSCRVDGRDDPRVGALVRHTDATRERITDVAWAVRLELPEGRLAAVDPGAVDCLNEARGL